MENLMIHNIRKEYFKLPLKQYTLTFDDGLFSHYYYYPLLNRHNDREMLFFIPSSFIRPGGCRERFTGEYIKTIKSKKYMYQAVIENNFAAFMRVEELQELAREENVRLGVHSHFHDVILTRRLPKKSKPHSRWKLESIGVASDLAASYGIRSKLAFQGYHFNQGELTRRTREEWRDYIKYDTESALQWFAATVGFVPDTYCFPFNEHNQYLIDTLKTFGFRHFYSGRQNPFYPEIHCRTDIDAMIEE